MYDTNPAPEMLDSLSSTRSFPPSRPRHRLVRPSYDSGSRPEPGLFTPADIRNWQRKTERLTCDTTDPWLAAVNRAR